MRTVTACSRSPAIAGAVAALLASLIGCPSGEGSGEQSEIGRTGAPAGIPDPYARSDSRFGTVPLHAGFSPDPRVVAGTAIGEVSAQSIHPKCAGWISEVPDYLLDADTAFFQLYVIGRSHSNVRLVLRRPDGSVLCTNGSGKTSMVIRSDFPIGTTQAWIGVAEKDATADYRLGLSEVKSNPSSIRLPSDD